MLRIWIGPVAALLAAAALSGCASKMPKGFSPEAVAARRAILAEREAKAQAAAAAASGEVATVTAKPTEAAAPAQAAPPQVAARPPEPVIVSAPQPVAQPEPKPAAEPEPASELEREPEQQAQETRPGFWARLFGRGDKQEQPQREEEQPSHDAPEPNYDGQLSHGDELAYQDQMLSGSDADSSMEEPKPRKRGWLSRLFGWGNKDEEEAEARRREEEEAAFAAMDGVEDDFSSHSMPEVDELPRASSRTTSRNSTPRQRDPEPVSEPLVSLPPEDGPRPRASADDIDALMERALRERQAGRASGGGSGSTANADLAGGTRGPEDATPTRDGAPRQPAPNLPGQGEFTRSDEVSTPGNPLGGLRLQDPNEAEQNAPKADR